MANQENKKENNKKGLIWFLQQKKNLPLILSLFGGFATVVTGTILLASGGGGSTNGSSQGGSQTSQPSNGGGFSGNELPDWDLSNPTISAEGSAIGVSYDQQHFRRNQESLLYQGGRNFLEDAPVENWVLAENSFSIFNMRTSEVIFQYTFTYGQTYKDFLFENYEDMGGYYFQLRFAYDGASTIYALVSLRLGFQNEFNSTSNYVLDGSFTPMVTYVNNNLGGNLNLDYQFLLTFDINNPTSYTIVAGRDASYNHNGFFAEEVLFENNTLYMSTIFGKSVIDNPTLLPNRSYFSFITRPTSYPTFVTPANNERFSYLVELNVSNINAITTTRITPITFDTAGSIWFYGYMQGFDTKYFDTEGGMYLSAVTYAYLTPTSTLETFISTLEDNFLEAADREALYQEATDKLNEILDGMREIVTTPLSLDINFHISGFFNFTTGKLQNPLVNVNAWYNQRDFQNLDNDTWIQGHRSQSYISMDNGEVYIIESNYFYTYTRNQTTFGGFSNLNEDNLISSYNALYRVNLSTNVKTLIEENDNNGKTISGIFEKEGGYFITGSYYKTDSNDVESVDAYLMEVDLAFEKVQEIVLSGSGDDQGVTIALNSSGRPVWIVSSNSTDGDFAAFATSNPDNRFTTYSVSF
jgi:hypothetical protein